MQICLRSLQAYSGWEVTLTLLSESSEGGVQSPLGAEGRDPNLDRRFWEGLAEEVLYILRHEILIVVEGSKAGSGRCD